MAMLNNQVVNLYFCMYKKHNFPNRPRIPARGPQHGTSTGTPFRCARTQAATAPTAPAGTMAQPCFDLGWFTDQHICKYIKRVIFHSYSIGMLVYWMVVKKTRMMQKSWITEHAERCNVTMVRKGRPIILHIAATSAALPTRILLQ